MKKLLMICTLLSFLGLRASGIELGEKVPALSPLNEQGVKVDLQQAAAKGFTLVYFYPKADTPGCTAQACSLRDAYAELQEKGVTIYGVSADRPESQKAFREKYHLPFELLADPDGALMALFDVPRVGAFAKRQAYLFKDCVLVWKDESASTGEQAADILKVLPTL